MIINEWFLSSKKKPPKNKWVLVCGFKNQKPVLGYYKRHDYEDYETGHDWLWYNSNVHVPRRNTYWGFVDESQLPKFPDEDWF